MLLVIGSEDDVSTDYFMEWCRYLNISVVRGNEKDCVNVLNNSVLSSVDQLQLNLKGRAISLQEVDGVWFRRGYITFHSAMQSQGNTLLDHFYENENRTLTDYLIHVLAQKKSLNHPHRYNENKLIALAAAKETGLNIPETLISRDKKSVAQAFGPSKVITKPVQDALRSSYKGVKFNPYIHVTTPEAITVPSFYYSVFQQFIDKKYELRIFFIESEFYACAIFPNTTGAKERVMPFLLPDEIKEKLVVLNARLHHKTGSIDMLVDQQQEYYFLEINPVGQYDYVSKMCNYYLDRRFATYFINGI